MKNRPFTIVSSRAAPMPEDNIDTDIIFPARFLLLTARDGLGGYAFHDRRFDAAGGEIAGFVFNRQPWRDAEIIVAGANFGSGSSREQAVWALSGLGVRCIIAPSFGEIFYNNCLRNQVLPIALPLAVVDELMREAHDGSLFRIDLSAQTILVRENSPTPFEIAVERKRALLMGWDETDQVLADFGDAIDKFEQEHKKRQPWLWAR